MSSEEREHKYAFVVALFFIFAVAGIFIYDSHVSTTGYAIYDSLSDTCKLYFGDKVCDDGPGPLDCGANYKPGTSLDACDECQTTKDGKLGYPDCGGAGKATTGGDDNATINSCKDSCGGQSKTGTCWCDKQSLVNGDSCDDISTHCPGIAPIGPPISPSKGKPNLFISSSEVGPSYTIFNKDSIVKQTGIYGKKGVSAITQIASIFVLHPLPSSLYYEINEDGSIIETSKGNWQEIGYFNINFKVSNNGVLTSKEFKFKLQKLKKGSSGWDTLKDEKLVLIGSEITVKVFISPSSLDNTGVNNLRVVIDTENKIAESNEDDNIHLFEINLKAI